MPKPSAVFEKHFPRHIEEIKPGAYYTRRATAHAIGVHEQTLLKHEQSGNLRASHAGRKVLYKGSDIQRWLQGSDED
jgi:hypothetical protein